MVYNKSPLSFEKQAELLLSRGLIADRENLIKKLNSVNYYRLSGYFYNFQNKATNKFHPNTKFDKIWQRYIFDRQLRIIILDAIERFEVSFKTNTAYAFSNKFGAFAYLNCEKLPKITKEDHSKLLSKISDETKRSKEQFVNHFFIKYGDKHKNLPVWMLIEIVTFGTALNFYKGMEPELKRIVAKNYNIPYQVLKSWLIAINSVRNICAHHSRLWNRVLPYKPQILKQGKYPEWYEVTIDNGRVFSILTILKFLMDQIAPQSGWRYRLKELLLSKKYNIPLFQMGFPDDWQESSLWRNIR